MLERIVTDRGIQTAEQIDALMAREPEQIALVSRETMPFWTFVFAITIAFIVAGVVSTWIRMPSMTIDWTRQRNSTARPAAICDENAHLKKQVAELTERLVVLERIATDPAERVSREIEKLR